ncbi:MAG: hypothetical protein UV25_C0008G0016 [candidate division WWE3 bacterium GW2011_GWB1_42_41]|nr:MAG: hypothetical protein UU86_C0009G0017 [candidate division WWE3 bacterium GW2011_GWC1_42_102]KKS60453.1 MAG: hypothetical protein UV25_C0008G0016 [candidate division WWE3 bacterium GW2011_GWB1_42_41]
MSPEKFPNEPNVEEASALPKPDFCYVALNLLLS